MSDTSCGWTDRETGQPVCKRMAKDGNTLCQEHIDEAIRLRKIKRQTWAAADAERLEKYGFILSTLDDAYKAGVAGVLALGGDTSGNKEVVVGHSRTNSQFYNVVMGTTKLARMPQPGWSSPAYVQGTINHVVSGLSAEAAHVFAAEYNAILDAAGIENTKAIVV